LKKKIYLFLALLLPALLFVFLKYAGRNEFNIPVYHESGVKNPTGCLATYPSPYVVPDSVWGSNRKVVILTIFPKSGLDIHKLKSRIEDEFGLQDITIIEPCVEARDSARCAWLRKCVLLVNDPWETVLIDKEGRIRGYYDLLSREDEDRLRVELKILLKKY
jgi:hypothetical protein